MTSKVDEETRVSIMSTSGPETFEVYQRVYKLIGTTNTADPAPDDVAELRRILAEHPTLWRFAGDTARMASEKSVDLWNATVLIKESTKRGMEALLGELGYEGATPMERMLIEQVVLCWVNLNIMEMVHNARLAGNHIAEEGVYWDRRLNNAQRRFTRACDSLARVRKLTLAAELHKAQLEAIKATSGGRHVKPLRAVKTA